MAKVKLYLESITNHHQNGYEIRIWRRQKFGFNEDQNKAEIKEHIKKYLWGVITTPSGVGRIISKLKRVNAVEVKHIGNQSGIVIYKNWP